MDAIILGSFLQVACQLHDGHIEDRNMEGYASELPIQLWYAFTHGLGSTNRYRHDVLGSLMAIIISLSAPLGSTDRMHLLVKMTASCLRYNDEG